MLPEQRRHTRPLVTGASRQASSRKSFSRNIVAALGFCAPLLLVAQALTSCGSDESSAVCEAGELNDCTCPGGATGEQVCNAARTGFDTCDCDGTTGGTGGSSMTGTGGTSANNAGSAGTAGEPPTGELLRGVGAPCETDVDCPTTADGTAVLRCSSSDSDADFGVGGPQGGYCTLTCQGDADCEAVDPLSRCGDDGDPTTPSICLGVCSPTDETIPCLLARPQACLPLGDGSLGLCAPMCTSDAACGEGRVCNLQTNLCADAAAPGGGVGTPCTAATEIEDCASGLCLTFTADDGTTAGFCSALCSFLAIDGCGTDGEAASGTRTAACLEPAIDNAVPGDLGLCVSLCDTDADCGQPSLFCDLTLFGDDLATQLGRPGMCTPTPPATAADAGTD